MHTATTLRSRRWRSRMKASSGSDVVLDVVFEVGLLHLELMNLGEQPAFDVNCSFEPRLQDAQGRDISELRVFRRLALLAPGRRIRTLLGSSSDYTGDLTVVVAWSGADGDSHTSRVTHDLGAFAELAYVI